MAMLNWSRKYRNLASHTAACRYGTRTMLRCERVVRDRYELWALLTVFNYSSRAPLATMVRDCHSTVPEEKVGGRLPRPGHGESVTPTRKLNVMAT